MHESAPKLPACLQRKLCGSTLSTVDFCSSYVSETYIPGPRVLSSIYLSNILIEKTFA